MPSATAEDANGDGIRDVAVTEDEVLPQMGQSSMSRPSPRGAGPENYTVSPDGGSKGGSNVTTNPIASSKGGRDSMPTNVYNAISPDIKYKDVFPKHQYADKSVGQLDATVVREASEEYVQKAQDAQSIKNAQDPNSEEYDFAKHLATMSDSMLGPNREVNIAMKGMSLTTPYALQSTPTVWSTFTDMLTFKSCKSSTSDHYLLTELDAIAKSGELTLIIGPPGSGKSTLLKALSTRFPEGKVVDIKGDLKYNRNNMCDEVKRLTSLILPYEECLALLTVGDTFKFAHENAASINTKYLDDNIVSHARLLVLKDRLKAGKMSEEDFNRMTETIDRPLPDQEMERAADAKHEQIRTDFENFDETMVQIVLNVMRLTHRKDIIVGNELVRGCSGGERRRVSVGESILKKSPILLGDEITNGLDANSALHLIGSMKKACQILGQTTILSVLQPSPDIYALFDRVIMLNEGKVIYSGKRVDAHGTDLVLQYFESLKLSKPGHMPTPDYLDLVTGGQEMTTRFGKLWEENHSNAGEYQGNAGRPETPQQFNDAWKGSAEYTTNRAEVDAEMAKPVEEFDPMYTRPFGTSFQANLKSVTARQFTLMRSNVENWKGSIMGTIVKSIVVGTLFWQLGDQGRDGHSRAGFFVFLIAQLVFGTFEYLPTIFAERSTLYNHLSQGYVRTSTYVIAQILTSLPLDLFQSFFFGTFTYWAIGLDSEFTKFVYFILVSLSLVLVANQITRCLAAVCPEQSTATSVAPLIAMILGIAYIGFLLPRDEIPPYFIWIYYLSPMQYAYQGLMINELGGMEFTCGTSLAEMQENGCTSYTSGDEELEMYDYTTDKSMKWVFLLIVFGYWFLLVVLNIMGLTYIRYDTVASAGTETEAQEEEVFTKPQILLDQEIKVCLSFDNLDYTVFVPASGDNASSTHEGRQGDDALAPPPKGTERLKLLDGCFGYFEPGTATALMGSSGAGKSTLMDVLAGMKTGGEVRGEVFINHEPCEKDKGGSVMLPAKFRRYVAYVEQSNIHLETQTVREAFAFSCLTRLTPFSQKGPMVEQCDRDQMVNYALYVLKLQDVADKQISDLNSQQKKRTTMGVELVSDPAILYLDEPTSGLDSVAALTVMDCIKTIKESGVTVIVTIHQPSEGLFDYFDMLLLLKKGGHEIYFGPCPKRPQGDDDDSRFAQGFQFFQNMNKAPEWRQQNPADYILDFCAPGDYDKQFQGSPLGEKMKEWIQGGEKYNSKPHQYYRPGQDLKTPTFDTPYALSMGGQMKAMYNRGATHYWRNPDYTFTRMMVSLLTALFLGLTYYDLDNDMSGCQYKVASIFLMIVLQVPYFLLAMGSIFEMKAVHFRERKSMNYQERAYFAVLSFVEYPYIIFSINVFMWIAHLLVGYNKSGSRMFFYWIFLSAFQIFMVFYGQMVAALTPSPEVAQKIASILTAMALLNAGFMLTPSSIPYGWKFLYWWSPYHYAIEALGANELEGMTCGSEPGEPLGSVYIQETFSLEFDNRWRNFGIIIGYALFCRIVTLLALKYNETIKR